MRRARVACPRGRSRGRRHAGGDARRRHARAGGARPGSRGRPPVASVGHDGRSTLGTGGHEAWMRRSTRSGRSRRASDVDRRGSRPRRALGGALAAARARRARDPRVRGRPPLDLSRVLVEPRRARLPLAGARAARRADPADRRRHARVLPAVAERSRRRLLLLAVHARAGRSCCSSARWCSAPPRPRIAFGTLLAVLGTYAFARTVTADRTVSLAAAALMLASPILAIQSGVYLGYLFTLGLGLLFGAALITGFERTQAAGCWSSPGAMVGLDLHDPAVRRGAVGRRVRALPARRALARVEAAARSARRGPGSARCRS